MAIPTDKDDQLTYARDEETGELVPTQQAEAKVITQPEEKPAVVKPVVQNPYLYDYGSMTMADAYKKGEHTPREIMLDRYRWGEENGKPMNWIEASYFQNADLDKTKADAEKEEKRKQWQDAFEHMGHGLITLGNFVGAVTGAPAPTTNTVDPIALTERQRRLRDATRAQREAYNKDFFVNYWKERAEERQRQNAEALQRYRESQSRAAHQRADAYQSGVENQNRNRDINTQSQVQRRAVQNHVNQQQANTGSFNAQTNRMREVRQGSGSTTVTDNGRRRVTTTRKPGTSPSATSSNQQRIKVDY